MITLLDNEGLFDMPESTEPTIPLKCPKCGVGPAYWDREVEIEDGDGDYPESITVWYACRTGLEVSDILAQNGRELCDYETPKVTYKCK